MFAINGDQDGLSWRWLTAMALLVLLGAATWALFVAPHLTALGFIIEPALRRRPRHTLGTVAGRWVAFIPVGSFPSYDHASSQNSGIRFGLLENILTGS